MNGEAMEGLQMRLGDSGEAYFLEELSVTEQIQMQKHYPETVDDGQKVQRKISEVRIYLVFFLFHMIIFSGPYFQNYSAMMCFICNCLELTCTG